MNYSPRAHEPPLVHKKNWFLTGQCSHSSWIMGRQQRWGPVQIHGWNTSDHQPCRSSRGLWSVAVMKKYLFDPPDKINNSSNQWEFQDPKMEVLYHIRPYFGGISPYIALKKLAFWVSQCPIFSDPNYLWCIQVLPPWYPHYHLVTWPWKMVIFNR